MTHPCILTWAAEADLQNIVRYTLREWGVEQSRIYIKQLEITATELALGQGIFRKRDDLYPDLRVRLTGHHFIFCLPQQEKPAVKIAILHERMSLITRLKERLD